MVCLDEWVAMMCCGGWSGWCRGVRCASRRPRFTRTSGGRGSIRWCWSRCSWSPRSVGSARCARRCESRRWICRSVGSLGYGLTEPLPHHATFSYAQCVRFASSSVFEQLFTQVLARCRDAGLLDGSRLIVDATHVEADAALKSLRAELEVIDGDSDAGDEPRGRAAAAAAGARRATVRADAEAHGVERDRRVAHRSGRQAALQARPSPASGASRAGRDRPQERG